MQFAFYVQERCKVKRHYETNHKSLSQSEELESISRVFKNRRTLATSLMTYIGAQSKTTAANYQASKTIT